MHLLRYSFLLLPLLLLLVTGCRHKETVKTKSPGELFPGLFEQVQAEHIFPDSKTFPDCSPKTDPDNILRAYRKEKEQPGFDLKTFVTRNFNLPASPQSTFRTTDLNALEQHIDTLWQVLRHAPDVPDAYGSLIPLPYSYIVPGGRFREIYYWDGYFTMLGLRESGRQEQIKAMLDNFSYLIRTYGFIPNGNRTYYLTRSQPPYFSLMVDLLREAAGKDSNTVTQTYLPALEKEYAFWMDEGKQGRPGHKVTLPDGAVLNRYYDKGDWPREEAWNEDLATAKASGRALTEVYRELRSGAESGWDYSSRWLADGHTLSSIQVTRIIPVDLNCLLYHLEQSLANSYAATGNKDKARKMQTAASLRRKAIQQYCWDPATGWFRDYKPGSHSNTNSLNLAGTYPLFFGLARQGQADSMSAVVVRDFLKPGGLVTTTLTTGQQWDAPNGWAPLQWMAIAGLKRYHKDTLAADISRRWTALNIKTFRKTGKLLEKYNVVDTTLGGGGGEYPNQDGFGWTNGVLLQLLHTYPGVAK